MRRSCVQVTAMSKRMRRAEKVFFGDFNPGLLPPPCGPVCSMVFCARDRPISPGPIQRTTKRYVSYYLSRICYKTEIMGGGHPRWYRWGGSCGWRRRPELPGYRAPLLRICSCVGQRYFFLEIMFLSVPVLLVKSTTIRILRKVAIAACFWLLGFEF